LISVVIPTHQRAALLERCLDSLKEQTLARAQFEVVVVDDGSTDGSGDVARRYGDAVIVARQENAGNGAARNHAVRLASGDTFAFLDADDRFTPTKLELQYRALEADSELDVVFGHVHEFVSPELTAEQRSMVRPPAPEPMPWTAPNLMLVRRSSFMKVGPFAEDLKVGVTVDWYARAMEAGLRTAMLPDILLERRLHLTNNGLRERDSREQYLRVLKASLDRRRARADR
jgi:glycosyltransferase involved in cell wall biosynthesis